MAAGADRRRIEALSGDYMTLVEDWIMATMQQHGANPLPDWLKITGR